MKIEKIRKYEAFLSAVILVLSTLVVAGGAFAQEDAGRRFEVTSSHDIVMIERVNVRDISILNRMGVEIIDRYGENALVALDGVSVYQLEQKGLRVNTLPGRNEIHVKGHLIEVDKGEPELDPSLRIDGYESGEEGLYLIHMLGPVNPLWRATLESEGVQIVNYVPNYAYEVVMTPEIAAEVEDLFFVDWVGIYQPEYKLHSSLEDALDMGLPVNIRLRPGFDRSSLIRIDTRFPILVTEDYGDMGYRIVTLLESMDQLKDLAMINDVYFISPYIEPELHAEMDIQLIGGGLWFMDDEYPLNEDLVPPPREGDPEIPYRLHGDFGAYINQLGYSGAGITITTADTGIGDGTVGDAGVSDFTGRVIGGYGFGPDPDYWADGHYHGTACTGLIAGDTYAGTGATWDEFVDGTMPYYMGQGLAYESEMFATKIFDDAGGFLDPPYYEIVEVPAQMSDAYIHSNSWGAGTMGSYSDSDEIFDQAVRDADRDTDENRPMVITTSAGNDGGRGGYEQEIGSPANAKNVITIGGNQPFNPDLGYPNPENMYGASSRGWTEDNRIKPDVIAPSESVISQNTPMDEPDTYVAASGTSFGNPLVAGAATIIVEWYEDNYEVRPSPAMVKAILINTANELDPEVGDTVGHVPNRDEGWGVPDISKLHYPTDDPIGFEFYDQESLLTTGDIDVFEINYEDEDEPLKITLTWTDKHAMAGDSEGGTPTLKNNLDLEVEAPGGDIFRGNAFDYTGDGLSDSGFSYPNTDAMSDFDFNEDGWDDVNNVQNVFIHPDDLEEGTYTIRVMGTNVPEDANNDGEANQDYALSIYNVPYIDVPPKDAELTLDRSEYRGEDTVEISLADYDLMGEGTYLINITSVDEHGTQLDEEWVTLVEDEDNLGFFTGQIDVTEDPDVDGALYVEHDAVITAWYLDEDPGPVVESPSLQFEKILDDLVDDVGVIDILSPEEYVNAEGPHPVEVLVHNFGTADQQDVPVETTIHEIITMFEEDFSGISSGDLPDNWTRTHTNWGVWDSNNAGGEAPELRFNWSPSATDTFRCYTPPIDTSDISEIDLSFKHFVNDYAGGYDLRVETSADGETWDEVWSISPDDDVGPETITLQITENVGSEDFHMSWTFDGNSFNINQWFIDDISLGYPEEEYFDDVMVDVDAGDDTTAVFDDWIPSGEGRFLMNSTTLLDGDEDPTNDYLTQEIIVEDLHDVGVSNILSPPGMVNTIGPHPVEVEVTNFGTYDEIDVPVEVTIEEIVNLLYEDFTEEIPDDWTIENTTEEPNTWHHRTTFDGHARCEGEGDTFQDEWLISPMIDASDATGTRLLLDHHLFNSSFSGASAGMVMISSDGGDSWELLEEIRPDGTDNDPRDYDISTYADGEEEVQIAFVFNATDYDTGGSDYWRLHEVSVMYLAEEYEDEIFLDIEAGETKTAIFDDWIPSGEGEFFMNATTDLPDDEDPTNDYETQNIIVLDIHDVGVTEIYSPIGTIMEDDIQDVEAEVENFGTLDEVDVPVEASIYQVNELLYEDFTEEIPDEWTIVNTTESPNTWHHAVHIGDGTARCEGEGDTFQDEWLISPMIDATDAINTRLELEHHFWNSTVSGSSQGRIMISSDGGVTWDLIEQIRPDGTDNDPRDYDISAYADGEEEVQIAIVFNATDYDTGGFDYWRIHEVSIYYLSIEYFDEITIDLDSGENKTAVFEEWNPSEVGEYIVNITTNLDGDEDPTNDYQVEYVTVIDYVHDYGVDEIIYPESIVWNETQPVSAIVSNYGDYDVEDLEVTAMGDRIVGVIEDFSGEFPPPGWETDDWTQSNTDNAGGEPPEAHLSWTAVEGDYSYLETLAVDTQDAEELTLEFRSYINHFSDTFNARVLARSTPGDEWEDITPWDNPVTGDVGPDLYEVDITDHIGPGTQVMFEFEGDSWNLNHWYIDDVMTGYLETEYFDETTVDLDVGENITVNFEDWTPSVAGSYQFNVTAYHPEDVNPDNATLMKNVYVKPIIYHLEATSIDSPVEPVYQYEQEVLGTVTNLGNQNITNTSVGMTIDPILDEIVLDEDFTDGLPPGWTVEDRDDNDNTWSDEYGDFMQIIPIDDFENDVLWTEAFDCSEGTYRVFLDFLSEYEGTNDRDLLLSLDGGDSYRRIGRNIGDGEISYDITRWASGEEEVMIGWEFYTEEAEVGEFWKIDNVTVTNEYLEEEYSSQVIVDHLNVTESIQLEFDEWTPDEDVIPSDYLVTLETFHEDEEYPNDAVIIKRIFVDYNYPPDPPSDPIPYDGQEGVTHSPMLNVSVSDPNEDDMDVTFYLLDEDSIEIKNVTVEGVESDTRVEAEFLFLDSNSTYQWYVEAFDGYETTTSETWTFHTYVPEPVWKTASATINAIPPEPVENLHVDWDDDVWNADANELTWYASPDDGAGENDTTHYVIYRSDSSDGPWDESTMIDTIIADGSESYIYLDEGKANDGVRWHYVVRAVDRVGNMEMNEDYVAEQPIPVATDPEPEHGVEVEGLEQTVSVHVDSPTGEPLNVVFYHGVTREILAEHSGVIEGRVEADYILDEEDMGQYNYWFVLTSYEDYNVGRINPASYSLTVDVEGFGTVEIDPEEVEYVEGDEVTLTAIPEEDWYFVEWTGDYEGTEEEITIIMDSDKQVTAHFEFVGEFEEQWRWLYDHDHRTDPDNAVGATAPGVWYGAMILDLSDAVDGYVSEIAYYDWEPAANYIRAHVAEDEDGAPGDWLASSDDYVPTGAGWVEIALEEYAYIESPGQYWIVLEIDDFGSGYFPFGCMMPFVDDGQYVNFDDPHDPDDWEDLDEDYGIGGAWHLEALVLVPVENDTDSIEILSTGSGVNVAVLDTGPEPDHDGEVFVSILEEELGAEYNIVLKTSLYDLIDNIDNYHTIVVQRISGTAFAPDTQRAIDFFDAVTPEHGLVIMDSWGGGSGYADGLICREEALGDPVNPHGDIGLGAPVDMLITEDHPIFHGIGSEGDLINLYDADRGFWFDYFIDENFEIVGDVSVDGTVRGHGFAVNEVENEVVLSTMGQTSSSWATKDYTPEARKLLANSVEFVSVGIEYDPMGWRFHLIDTIPPEAYAGEDIEAWQGDTIKLNGTASTDNVGIVNYTWTIEDPMGDETILYGGIVNYTLEYALYYDVTLTVYDEAGNYDSDTLEIYAIDTEDPVADAGKSGSTRVGEEFTLDGSGSTDNVEVVNWTWHIEGVSDAAEGYEEILYGETLGYYFPYQGIYEVTLLVSDAEGNWDTEMITIFVSPPAEAFEITSPQDGEVFYINQVTVEWEDYGYLMDMTYEIRINYGDWDYVGTSKDYTFIGLQDGTHVVQVRGTDGHGNMYTRTVVFEVDTMDPEFSIITPSNGVEELTFDHDFTIEGLTDPGVQIWINNEEVPVGDDGSFVYHTTLIDGINIFRVVSEDEQGNTAEMTVYALYLPDIQDLWTELDELGEEIDNIHTLISNLQNDIDALDSAVSDLQGQVSTLQSDIAAVENDIFALESELSDMQQLLDEIQESIEDLEMDLSTAEDDIAGLEAALAEADANIATLQSDLAALQADLGEFIEEQEEIDDRQDDDISMAWIFGIIALVLAIIALLIAIFSVMKKSKSEEYDHEEPIEEDTFEEEDLDAEDDIFGDEL